MHYEAYQSHSDALWPLRTLSRLAAPMLLDGESRTGAATDWGRRQLGAGCAVFNLGEITHRRPDWGIRQVESGGRRVDVREEEVQVTPFATLRRFRKDMPEPGPRVLLAAPMSGHFATLLRDTVRTMLADFDVHVTDWHNAREVPLSAGRFALDEYVEHLMRFAQAIGPAAHLVAICQPCVAALAAAALLAAEADPATPASLTLMAGPLDCRINPTAVNALATSKSIEWFERNLISVVPWRFKGAGRRVYPGFVQLGAFMSMNRERHVRAFADYHRHVAGGERDKAIVLRDFYEEYFAVADLPAEFYLDTVRVVFQECALARGELRWRGQRVDPAALTRTALLTIEGERDDICAVGQTLAAQDLCTRVRPYLRTHYVQADAGHYGVFAGKRWQRHIYPLVRTTLHNAAA